MNVGGLIAGVVLVAAAVALGPWICAKVWRDPAYAETMSHLRVRGFGYPTSRGVTRGVLALWFAVGFFGAGALAAAFLPTGVTRQASSVLTIAIVCFALGFAGVAVNLSIVWFNRPLWLVPPHMRDEDGMIVAWWRCRDLPPEQRRAAAKARRRGPARHRGAAVGR